MLLINYSKVVLSKDLPDETFCFAKFPSFTRACKRTPTTLNQ